MTLIQLHFLLAGFWFGLWAAETVLELSAGDANSLRMAAKMHRWIDLLFERPVAIAMLVTGSLLLARAWPAPPIVLAHAAVGLVPAIVNLACMKWVLERAQATDDARIRALSSKVKWTGLGIPLAMVALVIGLGLMPAR